MKKMERKREKREEKWRKVAGRVVSDSKRNGGRGGRKMRQWMGGEQRREGKN